MIFKSVESFAIKLHGKVILIVIFTLLTLEHFIPGHLIPQHSMLGLVIFGMRCPSTAMLTNIGYTVTLIYTVI